ncbi:unnamed protein product [marine sediment metagenome]|uniref:Uncharacterized protein n=1 Tax=marine sediment metagenome TaxID=412755 RepID=X1BY59_9ZZZZ
MKYFVEVYFPDIMNVAIHDRLYTVMSEFVAKFDPKLPIFFQIYTNHTLEVKEK